MFKNCSFLGVKPDISKWNTRNIIDKSEIFLGCKFHKSFKQNLEILFQCIVIAYSIIYLIQFIKKLVLKGIYHLFILFFLFFFLF